MLRDEKIKCKSHLSSKKFRFKSSQFSARVAMMQYTLLEKPGKSSSPRMAARLSALVILLTLCYSMVSSFFQVERVALPDGCARACPAQRDPSRFICARNRVTRSLGMFDSVCFFGRYNHCVDVRERKWRKLIQRDSNINWNI